MSEIIEVESEYLIEQLKTPVIDKVKRVRMDRDGTYYDLILMHCPNGIECGRTCLTSSAWLVLSGINGMFYAFQEGKYLAWDYVHEKLGRALSLSETDCKNITKAIISSMKE